MKDDIDKEQMNLVVFLHNSPLAELELEITRDKELPRDMGFLSFLLQ